jgi:hypothetical protein
MPHGIRVSPLTAGRLIGPSALIYRDFQRAVDVPPLATDIKPDLFIVGAPKSGTSAMSHYLAGHPEIFMARKEMHFFGRDLHFGSNFYRRSEREYLDEFKAWNGQSRIGEASVWYLFSKLAAEEIKAFNPRARIIIMVRDPVEMVHSMYHQFRTDCNEHLATFEEAWAAQEDRRSGFQVNRNAYFRQGLIYDEIPRYTDQIQRYFDVFGRERVKVVTYDEFAVNTDVVFGEVLDFLGVDSTLKPDTYPVINGSHCLRHRAFQTLLNDPLVRGTAIAMRSWLPGPVFAALQKIESRLCKSNVQPLRRLPINPQVRTVLKGQFQSEVGRLSELLGRDLNHWNQTDDSSLYQPDAAASVRNVYHASSDIGLQEVAPGSRNYSANLKPE